MLKNKILKSIFAITAFMLTTNAIPTEARHRGSIIAVSSSPNTPVLQAVTVHIGDGSQIGRGGVQLSSKDNLTAPIPFKGLDLDTGTGTAPATWSETQVSGTAGHWTLVAANTPEGTSALTPTVSTAGHNHLAGTYTFNVTGCDISSNCDTKVLTYVIDTNVATIGTFDRTDFGMFPTGFGGTAGAKLVFATGFNKFDATASVSLAATPFTNQVLITWADLLRPGGLSGINISGGGNALIQDINVSVDNPALKPSAIACTNAATNLVFNRNNAIYGETMTGTYFTIQNGCNNVNITNAEADSIDTGFSDFYSTGGSIVAWNDNVTINGVNIRGWYNNCYFLGSSHGWVIKNSGCYQGDSNSTIHKDCMQVGDGSTPYAVTISNFLCVRAGGSADYQGPIFGGGINGTGATGLLGYIAGGFLNITSGTLQTNSAGSLIIGTGSANPSIADNVTIQHVAGNVVTLNNAAGLTIGSASSPVHFYGGVNYNLKMSTVLYSDGQFSGFSSGGAQGTDGFLQNSVYGQETLPYKQTLFIGTISGVGTGNPILTVAGPVTTNLGTSLVIGGGARLSYPGCAFCGPGTGNQLTGSPSVIGTYQCVSCVSNTGPVAMVASDSYPLGAGIAGWIRQTACDNTNVQAGVFNIKNVWTNGTYFTSSDAGGPACTPSPANTILTNVLQPSTAPASSLYQNGDPEPQLEALSSTMPTMTIAQLNALYCHYYMPKAGGAFDLGGGLWGGVYRPDPDGIHGDFNDSPTFTPVPNCTIN